MKWSVVYHKAIREDGTLFFPERLTQEFLNEARKTMGSYLFSNQYQNETIPIDEQCFRKGWLKYWTQLPQDIIQFAFIDPAIGETKAHDYTALVVVSVDQHKNWYVRHASRQRINPTQIVEMCFETKKRWNAALIGIEDVAFQKALVHFTVEEARRRGVSLPVTGIKHGPERSKHTRILSLVPRFEWGSLYLAPNLHDLELELAQFPRGGHDDILDALASIEDIVRYPNQIRRPNEAPAPNSAEYESWYIKQLQRRQRGS